MDLINKIDSRLKELSDIKENLSFNDRSSFECDDCKDSCADTCSGTSMSL